MDEAVETLMAKVIVIESIVRTLVVESLIETDHPVAALRDYADRVERSLTTAIPGLATTRAAMLVQAEIAEQFASIERWVRQAGGQ